MSQPPRLTFWRLVLVVTASASLLAAWQLLGLARDLDVEVASSRSWMGVIAALTLTGLIALLALGTTLRSCSGQACSRARDRVLFLIEFPARLRWAGVFLFILSLIGYTVVFSIPFSRELLGGLGWTRFFIFWVFSLAGLFGLEALKKDLPWLTALLVVVMFQTLVHLLVSQISGVTSYPFAMGWSETSRYYYPSLFLSDKIYGARFPWPILHPSLHLLLTPPYWFDAPLWFHRFWQVLVRFTLLGLTGWTLLRRFPRRERIPTWLLWTWVLLYLYQVPVYFHLAVPLILVLWGFSSHDDRRTWLALLAASVWSGLSRLNWYPVPGMLAAVLYFLEMPYQGRKFWQYILKPSLWLLVGTNVALAAQRVYIALSGIPDAAFFYTSLSSNLLWYRLLPNASYFLGVLPGVLLASLPMWGGLLFVLRQRRTDLHLIRLALIAGVLLVLFLGGLLVSMKIGGGVDIHNLDAYMSLLLVVTLYMILPRYTPESGSEANPLTFPWGWAVLLVGVPAWFLLQGSISFKSFDAARVQSVLADLQTRVDAADAQDDEILFITQRQLISMHMLENVSLVPEYEREELMEMAMGNNRDYLQIFRGDMDKQRFAMIVVDPLNYRLLGKNYPFGEENNAWTQRVMKPILCNYQEAGVFTGDQIAVYVPQEGERGCPSP